MYCPQVLCCPVSQRGLSRDTSSIGHPIRAWILLACHRGIAQLCDYKGFPLAIGIYQQAHTNVWQAAYISPAGIALQPYINPAGWLNSNPK